MRFIINILVLIPVLAGAQVVKKGSINFGPGTGFGLYYVSTNEPGSGSPLAVSGLMNLHAGYALSEKFSLGIRLESASYLTRSDSTSHPEARITDLGLNLRYRLVNGKNAVIFADGQFGTAKFTYMQTNDTGVYGRGICLQGGIGAEYLFTPNIGLFLYSSYILSSFRTLRTNKGIVMYTDNQGEQKKLAVRFDGLHVRIGLTFYLRNRD